MVWSLEWGKTGSWEKTSRQYRCEPIFADRGEESALGFWLPQLYSVEHWKVGFWDCSGISHAFALTGAKSMQMTLQRWEWEPISKHLFGRSGFGNCSIFGIHEAIKIFGIPQSRVPFTFSQQSCAVFGIHNFGISNPKFRNLRFQTSEFRMDTWGPAVPPNKWTRIQCIWL